MSKRLSAKRGNLRAIWTALALVACSAWTLPAAAADSTKSESTKDLGTWSSATGQSGTTVYLVDKLYTGTGSEPVNDGALVIRDGRIVTVTTKDKLKIEPGWKVETLTGSTLIPGMVIAETGLLTGGDEERTLTPEIRSIDGFDFFAEFDPLLAAGITSVQVSAGENRLIPGQTAVVKLAGDDPVSRTVSEVESLRIQLTQSAFATPTIYEPPVAAVSVDRPLIATRYQVARDLPSALLTIRSLWKAIKSGQPSEDPDDALILDSIKPFVGKTVRVTARSGSEILAAVELMEELDQPFVLVAPSRIEPVINRLAACKQLRGIVLEHDSRPGAWTSPPDPDADTEAEPTVAEKWWMLKKRLPELRIALKPIEDADLRDIRFLTAMLDGNQQSVSSALASITGDAAALLGVEDQVGTLAAGRDADFVILSGPPLDPESQVMRTYIDGDEVYRREPKMTSMLLAGATVCLPDGTQEQTDISVAGRSIRAVGSSVSASSTGKTYPLDGCFITPIYIDAGTKLGAGRAVSTRISMGDKLGKYLVPDDPSIRRGRLGGVGIGLLSSDSLPSPVVAFKLSDQPRVLKDPVALRSRLSGNPTTAAEALKKTLKGAKAYADSWVAYDKKNAEYKVALAKYEAEKKKYDEEVAKKKKEEEAKKKKEEEEKKKAAQSKPGSSSSTPKPAPEKKPEDKDAGDKDDKDKDAAEKKDGGSSDSKTPSTGDAKKPAGDSKSGDSSGPKPPTKPTAPKEPRNVSTLEPYRSVFKNEIPLIIEVSEESGVATALDVVVDQYKVKLVLAVSGTAYLAADKIAEKDVPVIVGPTLTTSRNGQDYNLPQYFRTAGCTVMVQTRATTQAASLPSVIAHSASRGLGRSDAVQALSSDPADVFQLPNVGKIQTGFDADFTVFDGPPFYPASRVVGVMIDGQWVYLDSRYDAYGS